MNAGTALKPSEWTKHHPESLALYDVTLGEWWTYGQLDSAVADLAARLRFSPKCLAVCYCRNDLPSVLGYLACIEAGHAVLLMDANSNASQRQTICDRYRPEILVLPRDDAGEKPDSHEILPTRAPEPCIVQVPGPGEHSIHEDLCLLLSTSGSTGSPKLVRLSATNVASNAASIVSGLGIGLSDRPITSLALHYSYGLSVLNSHLAAGAAVVLTGDGLVTESFWRTFRELECTSLAGVPYSYSILARLGLSSLDVPSLTTLTQAGGKLGNDLILKFHRMIDSVGGRFFVMYGQTEATARISILPSEMLPEKVGSAGLAVEGGHLSADASSASDERIGGEVVYTGPNVMMGYALERGDLRLADTMGGVLRTGDMGYVDDNGFLYVTGRSKRIGKVFGLRINLDEVEALTNRHGRSAVVGQDDRLVIFCEYGDQDSFHQQAMELARLLRVNHRAFEFRRVPELPTTHNGKIDYNELLSR